LISQARLPRFGLPKHYDPRFSGHKFGVLASCTVQERGGLDRFFEAKGAELMPDEPSAGATGTEPAPGCAR
jgi:hypothetical protein